MRGAGSVTSELARQQEQSREGVSLAAQEEKCWLALKLEADDESWPVRVYREEGESGKSLERPRVQELLRDVELGSVHGIICYSLDRLSRSILDFHKLFALCEQHGTRIISVSQKFDTSTPTGRLCLNMLMCFAQFEREAIADRITTAVRHLRANGHWTGGRTPFGYQLTRDAEGRCMLVAHPQQAQQLRTIFETVRNTRSLAATARILRRLGIVRPDGRPFHVAALHPILRNRTYLGEVSCKVASKTGSKTIVIQQWGKGRHEPLITQELFEAVAKTAYRRTKTIAASRKTDRVFPLQGLLYCTACRTAFTSSYAYHKGRDHPYTFYYRCQGACKLTQQHARCPFHNLNAEHIERYVLDTVAAIADDQSGWLDEVCHRVAAGGAAANAHLEAERQAILKERRDTLAERSNLTAFIKRAGTKAPAHLLTEITKLEGNLQNLEQELAAKDDAMRASAPPRIEPAALRALFKRLSDLMGKATPEEQQRLLRLFIQRVDVTRDGLVLHVYELPDGGIPNDALLSKDPSSKTSLEWWRIRGSNP